jgi:hypothetical protein
MNRSCTLFMLLNSTSRWRALDEGERREVFDAALSLVFNGYPDLRMTHYATDASRTCCSDMIVWETTDISQYEEAVEALGSTPLFGGRLFEIVDVIAGVDDDDAEGLDDAFARVLQRTVQTRTNVAKRGNPVLVRSRYR